MFQVFLFLNNVCNLIRDAFKGIRGNLIRLWDLIDAVASGRFVMLCVAPGAWERG